MDAQPAIDLFAIRQAGLRRDSPGGVLRLIAIRAALKHPHDMIGDSGEGDLGPVGIGDGETGLLSGLLERVHEAIDDTQILEIRLIAFEPSLELRAVRVGLYVGGLLIANLLEDARYFGAVKLSLHFRDIAD